MNISSLSQLTAAMPDRFNSSGSGQSAPVAAVSKDAPAPDNSVANTVVQTANRDTTSSDSLAQAVKQANDSFQQKGQNLYASFEKDKVSGIEVVKIVDKKTHETIRQMPSKEMVELARFLEQPQSGRGQLLNAVA